MPARDLSGARPWFARAILALSGALALGSSTGCTLALAYPPQGDETGMVDCANRADDDYDGLIDCEEVSCRAFCAEVTEALCTNGADDDDNGTSDCADPSCDGHCPERSPEACRDGRDQDGDELVDRADPGCWPTGSTSVTRCTSLDADGWTGEFDGLNDGWSSSAEPVERVTDATGRFAHPVLAIPSGLTGPVAHEVVVTNARAVTGGIDGLVLTLSYRGPLQFGLVATGFPPRDSIGSMQVWLSPTLLFVDLVVGTRTVDMSDRTPSAVPPGWIDAEVRFDGEFVDVSFSQNGTVFRSTHWAHGATIGYGTALRFEARSQQGAVLGEASLSRPSVEPCGAPIPARDAPSGAHGYVRSVASSGSVVCAMINSQTAAAARSIRSDDGGRTFTGPSAPLALSTEFDSLFPCVGLTWDADAAQFVGWARAYAGTTPATAYVIRSADCMTWTSERMPDGPDWPVCADYAIVGRGATRRHELWESTLDAGTHTLSLTRYASATPFDASSGPPERDEPIVLDADEELDAGRVIAFPEDLIVTTVARGEVSTIVLDRRSRSADAWVSFLPTGIVGACDGGALNSPVLFIDPTSPGRGALAHACVLETGEFPLTDLRTFEVTIP